MVSRGRLLARRRRQPLHGSALLMALVLLVVIGLASASSIHQALAEEKAVTGLRLEAQAQQYAELALKYCEGQLVLDGASRIAALKGIDDQAPVAVNAGTWSQKSGWSGAIMLPAAMLGSADSSTMPRPPECLAERVTLSGSGADVAYLVTARGFSPGFDEDATTGQPKAGSVVWLQSFLAIN